MDFIDEKTLREQMWLVREAESIGLSIRKELALPLKLRLLEAQVDIHRGEDRVFLYSGFRDILSDESGLNVDEVNPFIVPFGFGHWARKGKRKDGYTIVVQLCTVVTPRAELEEKEKGEYRERMAEEKVAGTYDEFTYKKYKK
jgi:hypothetical protein